MARKERNEMETYAIVRGSLYLGKVEADSPQQALENYASDCLATVSNMRGDVNTAVAELDDVHTYEARAIFA
jgi:hypothetical protein